MWIFLRRGEERGERGGGEGGKRGGGVERGEGGAVVGWRGEERGEGRICWDFPNGFSFFIASFSSSFSIFFPLLKRQGEEGVERRSRCEDIKCGEGRCLTEMG